jgi:hypothetical protein
MMLTIAISFPHSSIFAQIVHIFDEQTILKNCPSYFSGPICLENRVITGPITLNDTNLFVSVTIEPAAIK